MAHLAFLACWTQDETNQILDNFKENIPPILPKITLEQPTAQKETTKVSKSKKKRYAKKLEIKDLFRSQRQTSYSKKKDKPLQLPPLNYKEGTKENPIILQ